MDPSAWIYLSIDVDRRFASHIEQNSRNYLTYIVYKERYLMATWTENNPRFNFE